MKRANSKGAGEKSLHKPELVGQARVTKANWIKQRKPKGCKLEGSRRESTAQTRAGEAKHAKKCWIKQNKHKHATNLTGAEGVALHKPGVCEAKHAKQSSD